MGFRERVQGEGSGEGLGCGGESSRVRVMGVAPSALLLPPRGNVPKPFFEEPPEATHSTPPSPPHTSPQPPTSGLSLTCQRCS